MSKRANSAVRRGGSMGIVVLGMHRSGTSAVTGLLNLCGAWVGEKEEQTRPNIENPTGFWERRDLRAICDRLLHSTGAEWWKVSDFDARRIPHAILLQERKKFEQVVERLAQHKQWVIKEPRLCLLAPVLRDYLPGAAYVHVWRHPLEVASSLKLRNGFPLHGSVALWELYNRHALEATRNVPRVVVAYRDLMRRPEETLNSLLEGLRLMGVANLRAPKKGAVARLVDPVLYRHRAVETGYEQQLSPDQVELLQHMEEARPDIGPDFIPLSRESRRYLVELEAAQLSFLEYVEEANVNRGLIRGKDRAIAQLEGAADRDKERVRQLEERLRRRDADIGERDKTIGKLEQRVEKEANVNRELIRSKDGAIAQLKGDVDREKEQVRQSQDTLEIERRRFEEYVEEVNVNRKLMEDRLGRLDADLGERDAAIGKLEQRVEEEAKVNRELIRSKDRAIAQLEGDVDREKERVRRSQDTLEIERRCFEEYVEEVNVNRKLMEDRLGRLDADLGERDAAIRKRDAALGERDETIGKLEQRVEEGAAAIRKRDAAIRVRDERVARIHRTFSWKVTLPFRMLRRLGERASKSVRREVRGKTGQSGAESGKSAEGAKTRPGAPREKRGETVNAAEVQWKVRELVSGLRAEGSGVRADSRKEIAAGRSASRLKVSVVAWCAAHNPLGRAYLLADMLRRDYDVEIVAAVFERYGKGVWMPIRDCSEVKIKTFAGDNFPEHFRNMEEVARRIDGDVVYVSKARLPSMALGALAKEHRNRPVILDVDDYELGFFREEEGLTLEALRELQHDGDWEVPHGRIWTRYCESLVQNFDALTVASAELQSRYGGVLIPHARDEGMFDPFLYPREHIRSLLKLRSEDRVIMFLGTPRAHKGVVQVAEALESMDGAGCKLVIIGSPSDHSLKTYLEARSAERVRWLSDVQFRDIPAYLRAADLVCLIQDPAAVTAHYQVPAKFTDALAMGVPVLASDVPPLARMAKEGLVEVHDGDDLASHIEEVFSDMDRYRQRALANREVFSRRWSYEAVRPALKGVIEDSLKERRGLPGEFGSLLTLLRATCGDSKEQCPTLLQESGVVRSSEEIAVARSRATNGRGRGVGDGKVDVVLFWKQNDSGIYGRRHDMLMKYLSRWQGVNKVLHLDAPMSASQLLKLTGRGVKRWRGSQDGLVAWSTLKRGLGLVDRGNTFNRTFIYQGKRKSPKWLRRWVGSRGDYGEYVSRTMRQCGMGLGERRTVFWVCPSNFEFPRLVDELRPDLVVADVIDDQRTWPGLRDRYRDALSRNYEDIVRKSDLVFANCHAVAGAMGVYCKSVTVVPNAAEVLDRGEARERKRRHGKPASGPVIGYVGNLDSARLDLELLERMVSERREWSFVFVGSMHRNDDIRSLKRHRNVRFLGPMSHERAFRCMSSFDVGILPHADNELTRHMSPLKVYAYIAAGLPVVSTEVGNLDQFEGLVFRAGNAEEFGECLDRCVVDVANADWDEKRREFLERNRWERRVETITGLLEAKLESADPGSTRAIRG